MRSPFPKSRKSESFSGVTGSGSLRRVTPTGVARARVYGGPSLEYVGVAGGIQLSIRFRVCLLDLIAIGRASFVWRGPSRRLRSDLGEPLQDFYSLPHSPRRDSSSGTLVESWNESLQRCFRLLRRAPPKFSDPMLHVSICEQPRRGGSCRSIRRPGIRECVTLRSRHSARDGLRKHLVAGRGKRADHRQLLGRTEISMNRWRQCRGMQAEKRIDAA